MNSLLTSSKYSFSSALHQSHFSDNYSTSGSLSSFHVVQTLCTSSDIFSVTYRTHVNVCRKINFIQETWHTFPFKVSKPKQFFCCDCFIGILLILAKFCTNRFCVPCSVRMMLIILDAFALHACIRKKYSVSLGRATGEQRQCSASLMVGLLVSVPGV